MTKTPKTSKALRAKAKMAGFHDPALLPDEVQKALRQALWAMPSKIAKAVLHHAASYGRKGK